MSSAIAGIDNDGLAGIERGLDDDAEGPARAGAAVARRARPVHPARGVAAGHRRFHRQRRRRASSWTSTPARSSRWCRCRISIPNHPGAARPGPSAADAKDRMFNKITLGDYELGSIFKIFNTAMALDCRHRHDDQQLRRQPRHPYRPLHDQRLSRQASLAERPRNFYVFVEHRLGPDGDGRRAPSGSATSSRRLGLLKPVPIEFDEVCQAAFPGAMARSQRDDDRLSATGSRSPRCSFAPAVSAIVNGGILRQPTLLKLPPGDRAAGRAGDLAQDLGANAQADAPSGRVRHRASWPRRRAMSSAARPARRRRTSGGHYQEKKLLSDFVGVFPMHDPRYLILTLVDEPHGNKQSHGYATAGWTVAPATSRIVQRIAPLLGVAAGRRGIARRDPAGADGREPAGKAD